MITQKELDRMREDADFYSEGHHWEPSQNKLAGYILTLLDELERINRLGTEVREINDITDGVREKIWPKREE